MRGHIDEPVVLLLLYTLEVALAQDIFHTSTTEPPKSTITTDIPNVILFYSSPVITLIILVLTVFLISQSIKWCQRKFRRTSTSGLPTISATVQNGSDADPPPPYTFTDVTCDLPLPKVSVSNCPPYTKDPPTYQELTIPTHMFS